MIPLCCEPVVFWSSPVKVHPHILLFTALSCVLPVAAQAQSAISCNQLGRELALRATEQGIGSLSAADRTELAQLAETVCVEFQQSTPAVSSTPVAPSSAAPAAAPAAEQEEERKRGLFDLEIIDPADRVRRPGLKRP